MAGVTAQLTNTLPELYDAHLHIIDQRYPLIPNQGYLPQPFTHHDYLARMQGCRLSGGVVVSGSFQGFDQTYLRAALRRLGPSFVGVAQLPASVTDRELIDLDSIGVRAVRFNLRRGGSELPAYLEQMARRIFELNGWHVELYADAGQLSDLVPLLTRLPAVSIDHMGLSKDGLKNTLRLAEKGVRIKATGFGRVDFDVRDALKRIHQVNPQALMFGTDLPSTRAARAYQEHDMQLVVETLGESEARKVLYHNAVEFYRPMSTNPAVCR